MPAPRNYYPDAVSAAAATVGRVLSTDTTGTFGTAALTPNFAQNTTASWRPSSNVGVATAWALSSTVQDGVRAVAIVA